MVMILHPVLGIVTPVFVSYYDRNYTSFYIMDTVIAEKYLQLISIAGEVHHH